MLGELLSLAWWPLSWLLRPAPLAALAVILALTYRRLTRDYAFWSSRGVPGPPAKFPSGHGFHSPRRFAEFQSWLYYEQGGKRYCGYVEFLRPVLYVGDPDLIRAITVKDFDHFTDRRDMLLMKCMEKMMPALQGRQWKETRAVMTPAFSASKLKAMHHLCLDNASNLSSHLREEMQARDRVELKDAFGRFTMDNIASCAFGVNCNSFRDPNTEFAMQAAKFFKPLSRYDIFRVTVLTLLPRRLGNLLPDRGQAVAEFFQRVVLATIAHRDTHGTTRSDYLQLLLDTKDKDGTRVLTNDSIVANCVLFFIAGYDTTASLLTFAGFALATSPDCQREAQREIDEVLDRHGGQLTYEAVSEMTYLDRVLSETLRLYSPLMRIDRKCTRDYTLPGTDVTIPRGTIVAMPVLTMHRDPEHYPDPLRFDPDRFLPEAKEKRHPCAYMPFGAGPRNCIAQRFALFEAKVALAAVLRDSSLEPGPDTPPPPLPLDPASFFSTPGGPVCVRVLPRGSPAEGLSV